MGGDLFKSCIWAIKLVVICCGIISTLILFKVAINNIPFIFHLTVSTLPSLWISLRCWLSPLYIYIILNFIIITIAAYSTLEHQNNTSKSSSPKTQFVSLDKTQDLWANEIIDFVEEDDEKQLKEPVISINPSSDDHEEEGDTLEKTWKTIMEGKGKEGTRQLKKSETWDTPPKTVLVEERDDNDDEEDPVGWAQRELKKSETFTERSVGLRREKCWMSEEELNKRAEDFINKFNRQMRLQRQQSHQRYLAMVNQGV